MHLFSLASRLAVHVIKWSKTLPDPDHFKHSVVISVIVHGSSLAILNLLTYGLWIAIALCGNVAYQFLFKLTQWPISSGIVLPAIQKFPITVGFVLVSMAHGSCGGLAIICAVIMYFILLSKMYEDYLEEFVFKTAAVITEKLFGKKRDSSVNAQNNKMSASAPASAAIKEPQSKEQNQTNDEKNGDTGEEKCKENEVKGIGGNKEGKKRDPAKKPKKVDFVTSSDPKQENENDELIEKVTKTTEDNVLKSKSSLDVNEDGTIAETGSQESFELLYNQLDPEDVAMFTQSDEPEEMTEEERKEVEKAEAG